MLVSFRLMLLIQFSYFITVFISFVFYLLSLIFKGLENQLSIKRIQDSLKYFTFKKNLKTNFKKIWRLQISWMCCSHLLSLNSFDSRISQTNFIRSVSFFQIKLLSVRLYRKCSTYPKLQRSYFSSQRPVQVPHEIKKTKNK